MMKGKNARRAIGLITVGSALFWPGLSRSFDPNDAPEKVTIDSLVDLYGPVEFNHKQHTEMAACPDCHHHTLGMAPTRWNCIKCHANSKEVDTISCGSCHPRDRFGSQYLSTLDNPELYHKEKPGLKGAYHLNCVGCHQEKGGPTGCEDCHTMSEAGEKRFNSGKYAPASKGAPDKE
ncbi:MAG: cytochrome c3 family protein [Desulfobacteraceae bacterium]|nr:cytochrome c3 family protein [Desulfobacteraceae bacterium]